MIWFAPPPAHDPELHCLSLATTARQRLTEAVVVNSSGASSTSPDYNWSAQGVGWCVVWCLQDVVTHTQ
jgi:hypothetical protein